MEQSSGPGWFLRSSAVEQFNCDCEKRDTFPSTVESPLKEAFIWPKTIKFNMKLFKKKFFFNMQCILYMKEN